MPSIADFRDIYDYNWRVPSDYCEALAKLPEDELLKNREATHESLKNIFHHILSVHDGWLNVTAQGASADPAMREKDFDEVRTMEPLRAYMEKIIAKEKRFLAKLTEKDLDRGVQPEWKTRPHPLRDALMQVRFEQAHHTGELIALFWQIDDELLKSKEASIRWKTRVHILGEERDSKRIRALEEEVRTSLRVRALLSRRGHLGKPGTARSVYYKWQGLHWVLASLADLGYPQGDETLYPIRDRILEFWLKPSYFHEFVARTSDEAYPHLGVPTMQGRYRRLSSQQGNALYFLTDLGIVDERADSRPPPCGRPRPPRAEPMAGRGGAGGGSPLQGSPS